MRSRRFSWPLRNSKIWRGLRSVLSHVPMTVRSCLFVLVIIGLQLPNVVHGQSELAKQAAELGIVVPDLTGFTRGQLLQMYFDNEIGLELYSNEITRRNEDDHMIAALAQYLASVSVFGFFSTESPYECSIGLDLPIVEFNLPLYFADNVVVQDYVGRFRNTAPLRIVRFPPGSNVPGFNLDDNQGPIKGLNEQQLFDRSALEHGYFRYWRLKDSFGEDAEGVQELGDYLDGLAESLPDFDIDEARSTYEAQGSQLIEVSPYEPTRQLVYLLLEAYRGLTNYAVRYGNQLEHGSRLTSLDRELEQLDPLHVGTSPALGDRLPDENSSTSTSGPKVAQPQGGSSDSSGVSIFDWDDEWFRYSYKKQNDRNPTFDEMQKYRELKDDFKALSPSPVDQHQQESAEGENSETSAVQRNERQAFMKELRNLSEAFAMAEAGTKDVFDDLYSVGSTKYRIDRLIESLEDPVVRTGAPTQAPSQTLGNEEKEKVLRELSALYSQLQVLEVIAFGSSTSWANDRMQKVNDELRELQLSTPVGQVNPESDDKALSSKSNEQRLYELAETLLEKVSGAPDPSHELSPKDTSSIAEAMKGTRAGAPLQDNEVTKQTVPGSGESTSGKVTIQVFAKATEDASQTGDDQGIGGTRITYLTAPPSLPGSGVADSEEGSGDDPVMATAAEDGRVDLAAFSSDAQDISELRSYLLGQALEYLSTGGISDVPQPAATTAELAASESTGIPYTVEVDRYWSYVIEGSPDQTEEALVSQLPSEVSEYIVQSLSIGNVPFVTTLFSSAVHTALSPLITELQARDDIVVQINFCWTKQTPNDPSFVQTAAAGRSGSWGQPYDDQWAIKRVGLTADQDSAWNQLGGDPEPVTVAVIDTGLDWNHLDISWDSIWRNGKEIPNNGQDDDGNGYIDDVIGWDFMARGNKPWDYDGHGTIVSGIIAATQNNEIGIAGINPYAKVMVLKSLNAFGNTRASFVAEAIVYAVDNGARLINISVGGPGLSRIAQAAVDYANEKGVLVVAAAGNEGQSLQDYGPAGMPGVFTVSATDLEDARTVFSNWGAQVDIAAPGMEVLSLRARRTDTMREIPGVEYVNAANYVGEDKRYYRVSGTSFAAPIVTGVASLVLSKEPDVSNEELRRILTQSAEDTEIPGKDQFTGYGIVNAKAALKIDRDFFIESIISGASVVQTDGQVALQVTGTADANRFRRAWVEIGAGENPTEWKRVAKEIKKSVTEQALAVIPAQEFAGATVWMLKLVTEDKDGKQRQAWFKLTLG